MEEVIYKEVPVLLVKTWIGLIKSKEVDLKVKERALSMLHEKIGTPEQVVLYMKKHKIN